MEIREALTRQSLLLEFISECVSLQTVPELTKLVTTRLHWICDYDTCTTLLPDLDGLSLWSQDRKVGAAAQIDDESCLSRHGTALRDAMAKGSPTVAHYDDSDMSVAALPLGSRTEVHGALCIARAAKGFSQGDIRHLLHACSALGGALVRIAALAAERKAEQAVKLAESELRAAAEDRMLLAEQMVGIVSHDLRNPLSAILMGTSLIGMGEAIPAKKQRVLQNVQSATRRAQRLVEDLLDFTQARVGNGLTVHMADVDLDELMTSIVDELRLSFPNVEHHPPDNLLGWAYLDADRIHQSLGNLVANAAMYGTARKTVRLKCEVTTGELIFSVSNEGEPIPEDMLASMFEPMIRGHQNQNEQHGVGLGLYIVRAIAQGHRGTVDVTSSAENGTCFSVCIPINRCVDERP
ncbi:sensor histidine kinase [Pseudomonas sp. NPDC088368]|jgi:signal transduction histidine kinase|uniref:sensor histidine kinase n=1 Tax=Pseudomonas sp. NPDC088368 TaxID=3364453 RepID=UPI0037F4AE8C